MHIADVTKIYKNVLQVLATAKDMLAEPYILQLVLYKRSALKMECLANMLAQHLTRPTLTGIIKTSVQSCILHVHQLCCASRDNNNDNNDNNICIALLGRNFRGAGGGRSVLCANQRLK